MSSDLHSNLFEQTIIPQLRVKFNLEIFLSFDSGLRMPSYILSFARTSDSNKKLGYSDKNHLKYHISEDSLQQCKMQLMIIEAHKKITEINATGAGKMAVEQRKRDSSTRE